MLDVAEISRRNLICGLAACAAVPIVAACGGSDAVGGSGGAVDGAVTPGAGATTPAAGATTAAAAPAGAIAKADIPVGGGKIFADRSLVVTQPTAGDFKAFSANCTHQGTLLNQIDGTAMICPNHGSRFSIVDGSVEQGPASSPLPEKTVDVQGDSLVVSG